MTSSACGAALLSPSPSDPPSRTVPGGYPLSAPALHDGVDGRADSLRRLHRLVREVNGDLDLGRTLESVCQGIVDGLGFEVSVLNLVLPDGRLRVVACAGDAQARATLLGTEAPRDEWEALMAACQPVGDLLVDYLHLVPDDSPVVSWVPDRPVVSGDGAWQPLDQLLAPLRTARSGLVGVISVDLPRDGCRPGQAQLELLEMYAAQVSIAIENAQLHDALLQQNADAAEALGRLSTLVTSTPVGIVELDLDGRVRVWNAAAERIFGWTAAQVLGALNPVAPEDEYDSRLVELTHAPAVRVPVQRVRRDGAVVDLEMSASVLRDDAGRPFGFLGVYEDTTGRRQLEEELRAAAHTDPLTGLANRALFAERLEAQAGSPDGATVLLLDLDGFKGVNDTAGHAAGDRVLVEVARRTEAVCRSDDLVARLGGDEFVVLLGGGDGPPQRPLDGAGAEVLAARLVEVLGQPVPVGVGTVSLGASVGLARSTGASRADDLLRDADTAMYAAKAAGKGRYRVFEPQLRADLLERTALVDDLRTALRAGDQLFLRWHPVVRVPDARVLGLEALVRWQHPTRGELAPGVFVPLAEDSGLVVDLGREVLHRACTALRGWHDTLPAHALPLISVNLSPVQVRADVVATVRDVLRDTGADPGRLVLELTEDVLIDDVEDAVAVLQELRALGVRLALDDFGAGYSSLAYLKRLPVEVVKLDRSLLVGAESDPSALALLDGVVGLVGRLGLHAVAEGVETLEQWQLLERLGCPSAQGYLVARPLRVDDVPRLLRVGRASSGTVPAR
ncbi:MAG: diguanylate cyclase [Frankiales bacterium]|nr:diguanylate cyclase [Frankiales bacterium]